jgi:hypothetical protein
MCSACGAFVKKDFRNMQAFFGDEFTNAAVLEREETQRAALRSHIEKFKPRRR